MSKQNVILTPLIGSDSISSATINSIQHQKKKIQKKKSKFAATFTYTELTKLKKIGNFFGANIER